MKGWHLGQRPASLRPFRHSGRNEESKHSAGNLQPQKPSREGLAPAHCPASLRPFRLSGRNEASKDSAGNLQPHKPCREGLAPGRGVWLGGVGGFGEASGFRAQGGSGGGCSEWRASLLTPRNKGGPCSTFVGKMERMARRSGGELKKTGGLC